jgi:acyl-CoA synthetase (AMP-forming)/AMP-acid ligase II
MNKSTCSNIGIVFGAALLVTLTGCIGYVDGPLSTLIGGHRQVLTETFDADTALDLVEREGGTLLHGFETHMKALADAQEARPRNLSTLRTGILAVGMASAVPTAYRARRLLAPLRHLTAYGITEVGANVSMSDLDATDEQACETSGRACPGFALRVVDPDTGRDRPVGVPGELWVRTRYMMQGYYRQPEETARALDADGWFHTGDMALLRPDGIHVASQILVPREGAGKIHTKQTIILPGQLGLGERQRGRPGRDGAHLSRDVAAAGMRSSDRARAARALHARPGGEPRSLPRPAGGEGAGPCQARARDRGRGRA